MKNLIVIVFLCGLASCGKNGSSVNPIDDREMVDESYVKNFIDTKLYPNEQFIAACDEISTDHSNIKRTAKTILFIASSEKNFKTPKVKGISLNIPRKTELTMYEVTIGMDGREIEQFMPIGKEKVDRDMRVDVRDFEFLNSNGTPLAIFNKQTSKSYEMNNFGLNKDFYKSFTRKCSTKI